MALALVLTGIAAESVVALSVVLMDGAVAIAVLAAAALAGGWVLRLPGMRGPTPPERLVLGGALGVGGLSLLTLALASAGLLTRPVAITVAVLLGIFGALRLWLDARDLGELTSPERNSSDIALAKADPSSVALAEKEARGSAGEPGKSQSGRLVWLWLFVCPFVVIALLAASNPPGVLWHEEANGYDVLEYHLAAPKAFYDAGRITFLPENVYSNFPLNSEMLSLFMMALRGDAIGAAFMATIANVGLAALLVAAAWLIGRGCSPTSPERDLSRRSSAEPEARGSALGGIATAVLAAGIPWITYLAGIAYVEVGMLAMGLCALAALIRSDPCGTGVSPVICGTDVSPVMHRRDAGATPPLLAGLLAGLACGFKYTAVPLIAIPLAGFAMFAPGCDTAGRWPTRMRRLVLYALGATITFSPWLIRNVVNTGNPVFPLAYSVFGARDGTWDSDLEARWQHAHGTAAGERADAPMWLLALARTLGDWRLGAPLLVFAAFGALRHRDRLTLALLLVLAWQFAVWLGWTHLFARFAAVFILPLIALAARAFAPRPSSLAPESSLLSALSTQPSALIGAAVTVALFNLYPLARLYYHETRPGGVPLAAYDHLDWFVRGEWPGMQHLGRVNSLDPRSKVLMVGDARSFYVQRPVEYATVFNRLPLADAVARDARPESVLAWLRGRGITHVLANWWEIARLRRTYGFYPQIDAALFERLVAAGLKPVENFSVQGGSGPYATLFEVPGNE